MISTGMHNSCRYGLLCLIKMFPPVDFTFIPPAPLSPITFNAALQQLLSALSSLLAHQLALSLPLSTSHLKNSSSTTHSNSQPLSYADILKSSSNRPSFTIRQVTSIVPLVPTPLPSPSKSKIPSNPPSPKSSPSPVEPKPVTQYVIPEQTPTLVTAKSDSAPHSPRSTPITVVSSSIVTSTPIKKIASSTVNECKPTLVAEYPKDNYSVSMRSVYPPVTALCSRCNIFPIHIMVECIYFFLFDNASIQ